MLALTEELGGDGGMQGIVSSVEARRRRQFAHKQQHWSRASFRILQSTSCQDRQARICWRECADKQSGVMPPCCMMTPEKCASLPELVGLQHHRRGEARHSHPTQGASFPFQHVIGQNMRGRGCLVHPTGHAGHCFQGAIEYQALAPVAGGGYTFQHENLWVGPRPRQWNTHVNHQCTCLGLRRAPLATRPFYSTGGLASRRTAPTS